MTIYGNNQSTLDKLSYYIGTDLWIWVWIDEKDYYMRAISLDGDELTCRLIEGDLIEAMETGDGFYSGERYRVQSTLTSKYPMVNDIINIADIEIDDDPRYPIYTTSDLLNLCDATGDHHVEGGNYEDDYENGDYIDDDGISEVDAWGISNIRFGDEE